MKRFGAVGIISAMLSASCTLLPENEKDGCAINLRFAQPVETIKTKALADVPDTNSFILSIVNITGDTVYQGPYGHRPAKISVPSGTYNIGVISQKFEKPAFETPCFGDQTTVIASNGHDINVEFLCKMVNCGVRINMKENFLDKYGNGGITVSQDIGELAFTPEENRYGYFIPGNTVFKANGSLLFNKVLEEGKLLNLNIDATKDSATANFSISIDTQTDTLYENIVVGENFSGENGLSASTAFNTESARSHVGDTVWVWGYIAGCYNKSSAASLTFTAPFEIRSNIAISSTKNPNSNSQCIAVSLSTDKLKNTFSLADNPSLLGKKAFIKGVIEESYFNTTGIKKILEYRLEE